MGKRIFIIWSYDNDMGFGVEVDEADYEEAKKLSLEGWHKWNNPEDFPEYEKMGYAEPAIELMDEAGISYRILEEEELSLDKDIEVIN